MVQVEKKACLIVIDGWGISPETDPAGDAIRNAKTPVMSSLMEDYQFLPVSAHGLHVGLNRLIKAHSRVLETFDRIIYVSKKDLQTHCQTVVTRLAAFLQGQDSRTNIRSRFKILSRAILEGVTKDIVRQVQEIAYRCKTGRDNDPRQECCFCCDNIIRDIEDMVKMNTLFGLIRGLQDEK